MLKAGSHVRHKHKHKKKYVWTATTQAQAQACVVRMNRPKGIFYQRFSENVKRECFFFTNQMKLNRNDSDWKSKRESIASHTSAKHNWVQ